MIPSNPWKSYQQVAAQTATRGQLVLMLYDGALRSLDRALLGFGLKDPAEYHQTINNNIVRAQRILQELSASLNMEQGGELAMHLRRLYEYMNRRLLHSNLNKSEDGIHETIRHLTVLRDAWSKMLQGETIPEGETEKGKTLVAA
jgi:flagellar protein FliS